MDRIRITLRVFGPNVDPDQVTLLLNLQPTSAFHVGDVMGRHGLSATCRHKSGSWCYSTENVAPGEFSRKLLEFVDKIPINALMPNPAEETNVDLFIGCFGVRDQSAITIDPECLAVIAERKWHLVFDFYVA